MSEAVATSEPAGALFVVATPIGNLDDITRRAVHVLTIADVVACEDTRRTGRLLQSLGIPRRRLVRVDAHTEGGRIDEVIGSLEAGERVALVSDAGTPGVSDPGARLMAAVVERGHRVVPIPGPSAALAALVASGLPTDRFMVEGFLPRKGGERSRRLDVLAAADHTSIVYESPQRLAATLEELSSCLGADRPVSVARELTKLHETITTGPVGELAAVFADGTRGEVVIVIGPRAAPQDATDADLVDALTDAAASGDTRSDAVARIVEESGAKKRRVYNLALTISWPDRGSDQPRSS